MTDRIPFIERLSISHRLAVWYGLSLFIMLGIFAFFLYESFHQSIHHNFDRHLRFEAQQLLPHIEKKDGQLDIDLRGYSRTEALVSQDTNGTYVRLLTPDGNIHYTSPNLKGEPALSIEIPSENNVETMSRDWRSLPARTLYYPIKDNNKLEGWLEVTGFEWTLHEELNRLAEDLVIIILISVLFSLGGGYWLSKRALAPISSLIGTARSIKASEMDKRLPVNESVEDELTKLARTFNDMLDRLERGFLREQRFTTDAAHELKTPLAPLRSEAEIMLRRPRTNGEYKEAMQRILGEMERMSTMVQLLLQLSRVEEAREYELQNIRLSDFVDTILQRKYPELKKKDIQLHYDIHPDVEIRINGSHLEQIIQNLLNNAIKYTPKGGSINICSERSGSNIIFKVEDSGAGFDKETRNRMFDRFYRSDDAEIQRQQGSGLGLPLVKAIINHYGGKISAYSKGKGQGSTFIVILPASPVVNE